MGNIKEAPSMIIQGDTNTTPRIYFTEPRKRRDSFLEDTVREQIASEDPARIVIQRWGQPHRIVHEYGYVRGLSHGAQEGFVKSVTNSMKRSNYFYLDRDF
mgnify:CR=1 FL=1